MKFALITILVIATIAGVFSWFQSHIVQAAATVEETKHVRDDYFFGEGVVMRYESGGTPFYYLLYETPEHEFRRIELRMTHTRGCAVNEGDLPCASRESVVPPPYTPGTYVRVAGPRTPDKVVVESIEKAEDPDRDFTLYKVEVGDTKKSGDIRVVFDSARMSEGCQVFVGCYDYDIPKAILILSSGSFRKTATLVPGLLASVPGGVVALVDATTEEALIVVGHGESR